MSRGWLTLLSLSLAAGLAMRISVWVSRLGTLDGDEAVWGLMARRLLDGEWTAVVTDERFEGGSNACVLKFQSAPDGALRVRAEAADGSWRSWGEGSAAGGRVRFRWTGDRGWAGTAEFELSDDGRSMRGTFVREDVGRTEYARAERR